MLHRTRQCHGETLPCHAPPSLACTSRSFAVPQRIGFLLYQRATNGAVPERSGTPPSSANAHRCAHIAIHDVAAATHSDSKLFLRFSSHHFPYAIHRWTTPCRRSPALGFANAIAHNAVPLQIIARTCRSRYLPFRNFSPLCRCSTKPIPDLPLQSASQRLILSAKHNNAQPKQDQSPRCLAIGSRSPRRLPIGSRSATIRSSAVSLLPTPF